MYIIYQYYEKFLTLFNKKQTKTQPNPYIGSITFKLLSNYTLDILCDIPDVDNLGPAEISVIAERYAEFLLLINKGVFKKQIFNLLEETYHNKDNQENNKYLFIDNVISFNEILTLEYKKLKKDQSAIPLIRPSQAFKNS